MDYKLLKSLSFIVFFLSVCFFIVVLIVKIPFGITSGAFLYKMEIYLFIELLILNSPILITALFIGNSKGSYMTISIAILLFLSVFFLFGLGFSSIDAPSKAPYTNALHLMLIFGFPSLIILLFSLYRFFTFPVNIDKRNIRPLQ